MSWNGRLRFLQFRGLTAASTAACVCAGWQPALAANSPQKNNDSAQRKLKYAAVDSPRLAQLDDVDIYGAVSKDTTASVSGWQPALAANSPQKNIDSAQRKLKYAAVDSPRLAQLDGVDIYGAVSKDTAASVLLKINSSTLDSPALASVVTEETTDNCTTSEEEEGAAASDDATEASTSSTIPTTSEVTEETTDNCTTSEEEEGAAASDDATEASTSSTIPTTSEEIKDSNSTTESITTVDDENKPEPLGFGDCDPYEPQDYYVDPSEPDEDTEAGPCRDEFRNWQKCIEVAKDREEDHMFACRCSVPTEIMAKCITDHPEYYDNSDATEQNGSKIEEEKEKEGGQIINTNQDVAGAVEQKETEREEGGEVVETANHDSGSQASDTVSET